ncbi:hypothetical protein POSPLADRAFT_1062576 [Postia placenta MAD-698-R-SB12]|uniref:Uncharacterized protein n=1 Tax=Postia placenta MAD-698-R-SB12 TaxID=670580 RepID=A0A1X6MJ17_9APHY|nr:hypothetical protein POSPLADRAFT_1062576 [Postia placenta MAD-698-R-SB12]OSX56414.1 hypothetical protein POSPLADRAFT_1062576 [Postia placenta MAD-698-R-SB12]
MAASAALLLLASAPATGRSSPFCAAGCLRVHAARSRLACGHDSCVGEHAVLRLRRRYIDFGEAAALVSGGGAPLADTKATWRLLGMLKRSPRSGLPRRAKLVSSMAWRAAIGTGSTDSSMAPCAQRALAAYISCVCAGTMPLTCGALAYRRVQCGGKTLFWSRGTALWATCPADDGQRVVSQGLLDVGSCFTHDVERISPSFRVKVSCCGHLTRPWSRPGRAARDTHSWDFEAQCQRFARRPLD